MPLVGTSDLDTIIQYPAAAPIKNAVASKNKAAVRAYLNIFAVIEFFSELRAASHLRAKEPFGAGESYLSHVAAKWDERIFITLRLLR